MTNNQLIATLRSGPIQLSLPETQSVGTNGVIPPRINIETPTCVKNDFEWVFDPSKYIYISINIFVDKMLYI